MKGINAPLLIPQEIRDRWDDIIVAVSKLRQFFKQYSSGHVAVSSDFPPEPPEAAYSGQTLSIQVKVHGRYQDINTGIVGYHVGSFLIFRVERSNSFFPQMNLVTLENEVRIEDGTGVIQVVLL